MLLSTHEFWLVFFLFIIFTLMIKYYSSCNKKFASFLFGFTSGIITLYPTIYIMSYFGGQITINFFTITLVSILGMPGTALLAVASIL